MSGLDFIVTGGSPDTTLPIAPDDDRILTPGSLVLFDPAHSADAMASGITDGQAIPNIAWAYAADLIGSGSAYTLAGTFDTGPGNNAASVLIERSAKGGIHVIMSQVGNTGSGATHQGAGIVLPAAVATYLAANPNHAYYVSRWARKTRAALSGAPSEGSIYTSGVSASGNSLFEVAYAGLAGSLSASEINPGIQSEANQFIDFATSSWQGTDPGSLSSGSYPVAWGQIVGSYQSATYNNKSSSYVLYRFYMEDLTVSGRSYAEVHAIEKAFWEADMATGGRYAGDTYTNPATLP